MTGVLQWLDVAEGNAPLIVSIPHSGTEIFDDCRINLSDDDCLVRADTDYFVDRLYDFAAGLGATTVCTRLSRTMIDVNRDPSGKSLYPGQATTELCPTTTFDGRPLYPDGRAPDSAEIARRVEAWHRPYHDMLRTQIERLRRRHPAIVLWDAHSIYSRIARLFDGDLPHLNFGTNSGASCAPALIEKLESLARSSEFSWVTNGRFKGGFITRHFGQPGQGVHAVQLEMAQRTYAEEDDYMRKGFAGPCMTEETAAPARKLLTRFLQVSIAFAQQANT